MNRLLNSRMPSIIPLQLHLHELKYQMDDEVLRRGSFDHQISLYQAIQELECVINGWNRENAKNERSYVNLFD